MTDFDSKIYDKELNVEAYNCLVREYMDSLVKKAFQQAKTEFDEILKNISKKDFLDIGAGGGRLTTLLAPHFKSGTAIEIQVKRDEWNTILKKYPKHMENTISF